MGGNHTEEEEKGLLGDASAPGNLRGEVERIDEFKEETFGIAGG